MAASNFYVYRIFDGMETVYVGKGSGSRLQTQCKKFGLPGAIVEYCDNDDHAFKREVHWIGELKPTANVSRGGGGGRIKPKQTPPWLKRAQAEYARFVKGLEEVGPRRFVARFLLRKLDESNCELYGVSKVDVIRLREVASGPRR
ncbi:hypothetical protein [Rhizobium mesoamericanum]|uniref:hypothetical protein n=1 Tax=Rhizobium mesoamericanum TaxID=1079800 RepID=UPI00048FEC0A|nr:hypothetical protein [Rhizobium mesoamericanum]